MKTALCLSGIVGGADGRNGLGEVADYTMCGEHFKKYVIEPNGCDVFIHSWSTEHKENLLRLYEPKKYKFEPQIDFSKDSDGNSLNLKMSKFRFRSKWHSIIQSLLLMKEHGEYDWVIVSRFDVMFLQLLSMSDLDLKFLYASNYSSYPKDLEYERWEIPPKNNLMSVRKNKIHDVYFIASYDNMLRFALNDPKDWYYECSTDPHKANRLRIFHTINNVIRYWGHRGYEWDLYRWRVCHSKT